MAGRDRPHILVPDPAGRESYQRHPRKIEGRRPPPPEDRVQHARNLQAALKAARDAALERRRDVGVTVTGAAPGIYVVFSSHPSFDLELGSLENKANGIELVSVVEEGDVRRATVFVPDGAVGHFLRRFEHYASRTTKKGEPRHRPLVESIRDLRLATLEALWTDARDALPGPDEVVWFEVWLRRSDGNELARFEQFAEQGGVRLGRRRLVFEERTVLLAQATFTSLAGSLDVLEDVAEVRRAKESALPFLQMSNEDQAQWVKDLATRVAGPGRASVAVCVLDTGVNRGHPLLEGALAAADVHAVDPTWGSHDHDGHGTEMAGLALFGDLAPLLLAPVPVQLAHRLESVKILPPPGKDPNPPELYGAVVAEAVNRPEISTGDTRRMFSMAVSSTDDRDRGQPSSWSSAIDALAAGRTFDSTDSGLKYLDHAEEQAHRLFVICAGNVRAPEVDHLTRSEVEGVHDPGQAWNAVTVGSFTELIEVGDDAEHAGWKPVAPAGELSPFTTTGVTFASSWPLKPDIVVEGGNAAVAPESTEIRFPIESLSVLSTGHKPSERLLVPCWATSASTAQAARLAAMISAAYPDLWPETLRGLLVHSAEWTPRMWNHFRAVAGRKQKVERLVRRYGFGVPSLDRAIRSAANALTLIAQDSIRPFAEGKMHEMHVHALPWPVGALEALFDARVRLRVTLSYFVEPNPARRGWKKRHRYASNGLRFDVRQAGESVAEFRKRLNKLALEAGDDRPDTTGDSTDWLIGAARNKGSLHADIWEGTAAELAGRGHVGVYPVGGWWKEQPARDRSRLGARYALIVSIDTDRTDVDIWTPVAQMVAVPVEV